MEVKVLPPPIPLTTADDPEAVETLLRTMGPEHALVGVRGQGAPLAARIGCGAVREGCAPRHPPFLAGCGTFATVHRLPQHVLAVSVEGPLKRERLGLACYHLGSGG